MRNFASVGASLPFPISGEWLVMAAMYLLSGGVDHLFSCKMHLLPLLLWGWGGVSISAVPLSSKDMQFGNTFHDILFLFDHISFNHSISCLIQIFLMQGICCTFVFSLSRGRPAKGPFMCGCCKTCSPTTTVTVLGSKAIIILRSNGMQFCRDDMTCPRYWWNFSQEF